MSENGIVIIGLSSFSGVETSNNAVTISSAALGTKEVELRTDKDYSLSLGTDVTVSSATPEMWLISDESIGYSSGSISAGYFIDGKKIKYRESLESATFTLTGLNTDRLATYLNGKIEGVEVTGSEVKLSESVLNQTTVTLTTTDNFGLSINESLYLHVENIDGQQKWTGYKPSVDLKRLDYINNDLIKNEQSNTVISADVISNYIENSGDNVSILGGSGDDSITNTGENVTIYAGSGDDSITNTGDNVSIHAGNDDDSITNTGDNVSIYAGSGDDSITNTGDNVTISASNGNDYIYNTGENVSIVASSDTTINNTAQKYSVSIVGGGAFNNRDSVIFKGSGGNDTVYNSGASVRASLGSGDDSINNSGYKVSINAGSGDDSITNTGDNVTIHSTVGNNYIENSGANVRASLGTGDDSISNSGDNVSIYGYIGDDYISNSGDNVSIYGYTGDDSISNSGDNVFIDGNVSNDYIYNTGDNAVVSLGYGNDSVSLGGENTHVTLRFAGSSAQSLNSVYGFDQVNHVIQIINSNTSITDTTINGGDDTRLILTNNATPSIQTTVDLYGVSEGSINVQFGDNEVTVYNLGGG